jgi:hypothetical protein
LVPTEPGAGNFRFSDKPGVASHQGIQKERGETKWNADGGKDINNPKVPLSYFRQHGELLYSSVGESRRCGASETAS